MLLTVASHSVLYNVESFIPLTKQNCQRTFTSALLLHVPKENTFNQLFTICF